MIKYIAVAGISLMMTGCVTTSALQTANVGMGMANTALDKTRIFASEEKDKNGVIKKDVTIFCGAGDSVNYSDDNISVTASE